jgi:hypothetical protein
MNGKQRRSIKQLNIDYGGDSAETRERNDITTNEVITIWYLWSPTIH